MKCQIAWIGLVASASVCGFNVEAAEPPAQTAADATADSGALTEIVVTATRREENLQHTAVAVAAVSGEELQRQGITDVQDLDKSVPGLGLSSNGAITQVYIRGVGNFAPPNGDSSVLQSVDGVVMGSLAMTTGQLFDLQRVEVLKGPQGTLYGRNATAGAVNFISNKPSLDGVSGDAYVDIGNYDEVKVGGAVNLPVNDQLAVRIAAQSSRHDGYFTDGSGSEDLKSGRLQMLYKPLPELSILFSTDYVHQGGTGTPTVPVPFVDPDNPFVGPSTPLANATVPAGTDFYRIQNDANVNSDVYGAHFEVNWDLGFATLTVLPAYRKAKFDEVLNPGFRIYADFDGDQKTFESRLASNGSGPLKWLGGIYYYQDNNSLYDAVNQGITEQNLIQDRTTKSYAAFGDATYSITDAFRVTGGLRYTNEKKTLAGDQETLRVPTQPIGSGYIDLPPGASVVPFPGEVSEHNVSGKAGVEYDVAANSLAYLTYSTGFRAGGINQEGPPNTYRPEILRAYTLGSKNRFFDNKLQANAELFYWKYTDHQENTLLAQNGIPNSSSVLTQNIGRSTLKGVSLDIRYQITRDDLLSVAPEYLQATFNDFTYVSPSPQGVVAPTTGCQTTAIAPANPVPGAPAQFQGTTAVNCSDKPFTRAPKWNTVAAYEHTLHLPNGDAVIGGVNTHIASWSYVATDFLPSERQGEYAITDVDVTYAAQNNAWTLTGYVRNVADKAVATSAFENPFIAGLTYASLLPPRTYGAQFRINF